MSQLITPAELEGRTEHELRALYSRIISDLARRGLRPEDCPEVLASLRNVQVAISRLRSFPSPKPKGFL